MIVTCSLASGSSGNAFFLQAGPDAFLIDAGICRRQLVQRLAAIGMEVDKLRAVFVTHEHIDHIRGLPVLLKHHPLPVFLTRATYEASGMELPRGCLHFIPAAGEITFNGVTVQAAPKAHDAADPCLLRFTYSGRSVAFVTDAGNACVNVVQAVRQADILYLESNYDEAMLRNGPYPYFLQRRISGPRGHLSNRDAGTLLQHHAEPRLRHLFLAHLSEKNNTPQLSLDAVRTALAARPDLGHLELHVAPRHDISTIVRLPVT